MRSSTIVIALGAIGVASASKSCPFKPPVHADPPEGVFMPARPGDVRSPCPMLNVLANHGHLPRNGKNITRDVCRRGMKNGLNLNFDFADQMFNPALLTNPVPGPTFDLDMLNRHNLLEHDGSLSRADSYWDDSQVFNQTIYEETLTYFKNEIIDIDAAAAARLGRMISSRNTNPTFFLNATSETISFGETAAYIIAMGDHKTGTVRLDRVKVMFEEERLPFELGWTPPEIAVTPDDLNNLTLRVMNITKWPSSVKPRMNGGIHAGIVNRHLV